ncbi:LytTR family DNA-binding domain-containing protein [Stakelama tenebrarum]|uniref:LytTR family transcriptional regulator n=1 Tax=Stakelama tenebrarum TaxID=2711215 RepID=A0A6G6Y4J5_9SPHN|nr:LytTR family DNA-binding domain-containing protein [Sphingosinithalassobacter tenebrarum]QIG79771.1 LytTR family transcriptional regulator [Sphingosinithalassobacter tenebrarum]
MSAAPRPARSPQTIALRWIAVTLAAGVAMGLLGPFGSYSNPGLLPRIGYWVGAMLLGLLLFAPTCLWVMRITPPGSRWHWPLLLAATLIVTIPEAAATRFIAFGLWPELAELKLGLLLWYGQAVVIAVPIVALMAWRLREMIGDGRVAPVAETASQAIPADVIALQMEDHYVRVHTLHGSSLLLMPLGQAIAGTRREGLRTHRSWWVARDAVERVEGNARSMRLHLSNGLIAPVARSAVTRLREARWIADV